MYTLGAECRKWIIFSGHRLNLEYTNKRPKCLFVVHVCTWSRTLQVDNFFSSHHLNSEYTSKRPKCFWFLRSEKYKFRRWALHNVDWNINVVPRWKTWEGCIGTWSWRHDHIRRYGNLIAGGLDQRYAQFWVIRCNYYEERGRTNSSRPQVLKDEYKNRKTNRKHAQATSIVEWRN